MLSGLWSVFWVVLNWVGRLIRLCCMMLNWCNGILLFLIFLLRWLLGCVEVVVSWYWFFGVVVGCIIGCMFFMVSDLFLFIESFLIFIVLFFCNYGGWLCFCCNWFDLLFVEGVVDDLFFCFCFFLEEECVVLCVVGFVVCLFGGVVWFIVVVWRGVG